MREEPWGDLPESVKKIQQELEMASGEKVVWRKVEQLDGKMSVKWTNGRPLVQFREYSHGGATHEFLHLLLDIKGYSRLSKCSRWSANVAGTILHNLLQHLMFFPRLKGMGFDHDADECRASERLLDKIQGMSKEVFVDEKSHHVQAMYATILMRAKWHCCSKEFNQFNDRLRGINGFAEFRDLASNVLGIIQIGPESTSKEYGDILDLCLKKLNLNDILEARPPDFIGSNG